MKILIVEDEVGIAQFLEQGLTEEGYSVEVENNGAAGLKTAVEGNHNLLLLDWTLPQVSGIEICKAFRKKNKVTPVIFLTAKDTTNDVIEGLKVGANDFVKKPFAFAELLERIKVQLRSNEVQTEVYTLDDITLNASTHQVYKGKDEVRLTKKEFALLQYLIQNKGMVCERKQIINDVWDIHFEYNTSIIEVYINSLRKKLGYSGPNDVIQTVRGIGYKIVE